MSGLLEHSRILIYGRAITCITIKAPPAGDDNSDQDEALINPGLLNSKTGPKQLATVYGFEFEGHYYDLATPAVLLVHGKPKSPKQAGAVVVSDPRLADDIKVWTYDKGDYSVRLDVSSGPLEAILLEDELDNAALAAETSGKRVSGKRVSGKRVSGKRMSGD